MTTRSKKLLLAAALLLPVVAVAGWMMFRPRSETPQFIFLGYTNHPGRPPSALVLITNGTDAPMCLFWQSRYSNGPPPPVYTPPPPGYVAPARDSLPRGLRPGATLVVEIPMPDDRKSWWTEFASRPQRPPTRLQRFASNIRSPALRRIALSLFPPVKTTSTRFGPITNRPPDTLTRGN